MQSEVVADNRKLSVKPHNQVSGYQSAISTYMSARGIDIHHTLCLRSHLPKQMD